MSRTGSSGRQSKMPWVSCATHSSSTPSNGWPLTAAARAGYHVTAEAEAWRSVEVRGRQVQRRVGQRGEPHLGLVLPRTPECGDLLMAPNPAEYRLDCGSTHCLRLHNATDHEHRLANNAKAAPGGERNETLNKRNRAVHSLGPEVNRKHVDLRTAVRHETFASKGPGIGEGVEEACTFAFRDGSPPPRYGLDLHQLVAADRRAGSRRPAPPPVEGPGRSTSASM